MPNPNESSEVHVSVPRHPSREIMTAVADLALDIYGHGPERTEHIGFFLLAWKYVMDPPVGGNRNG